MNEPDKMTADEVASQRNPIIGDSRADTLHAAACVAAFLARQHSNQAEALALEEARGIGSPGLFSADETRGLAFVVDALAAALRFELEGRQGAEEGAT